jgi:hypothetical protein
MSPVEEAQHGGVDADHRPAPRSVVLAEDDLFVVGPSGAAGVCAPGSDRSVEPFSLGDPEHVSHGSDSAYLRIYEPVSAFREPDRSRWAAYAAPRPGQGGVSRWWPSTPMPCGGRSRRGRS